jgi:hypothetical protein
MQLFAHLRRVLSIREIYLSRRNVCRKSVERNSVMSGIASSHFFRLDKSCGTRNTEHFTSSILLRLDNAVPHTAAAF